MAANAQPPGPSSCAVADIEDEPGEDEPGEAVGDAPQAHSIISCSRRTDVPANYVPWLVRILQEGHVAVQVRACRSDVSLSPDDVKAWVWWSKNYGPWLQAYQANPQLFRRYKVHLFHFTITGLDELEKVAASLDERLAQISLLAQIGYVVVRFDPLTQYRSGDVVRSNVERMYELIPRFKAAGASEVVFKFCVPYRPVLARMRRRETPFVAFPSEEKRRIIKDLIALCAKESITLKACCPNPDEMVPGLQVSACVDGDTINRLLGLVDGDAAEKVKRTKDRGQRKECRCARARDIGDGNYKMTCPHDCNYCYASPGTAVNPAFK
jgi:hypothetical protein